MSAISALLLTSSASSCRVSMLEMPCLLPILLLYSTVQLCKLTNIIAQLVIGHTWLFISSRAQFWPANPGRACYHLPKRASYFTHKQPSKIRKYKLSKTSLCIRYISVDEEVDLLFSPRFASSAPDLDPMQTYKLANKFL